MASGLNILIYGAKVAADIDRMLKVVDFKTPSMT
jgi:hypothetical protein